MTDSDDLARIADLAQHVGRTRRWSSDLHAADREDIIQDVIERYIQLTRTGEVPESPKAWLEKAIRNRELDVVKAADMRKRVKKAPDNREDADDDPEEFEEFSRLGQPSLQPVRDAYLKRLREAIGDKDWDLLWARYVEKLTVKEIAAQLGIHPDSVSRKLGAARKRAKELIEADPDLDERLDQAHPNVYDVGKRRVARRQQAQRKPEDPRPS